MGPMGHAKRPTPLSGSTPAGGSRRGASGAPARPRWLLLPVALLAASLACNIPGLEGLPFLGPTATPEGPTPTPAATPTPLPPLPPSLADQAPAPGEELPPQAPITLYFDQPMDPASVEAAFRIEPQVPGAFEWPDPTTLRFLPAQPLPRDTEVRVEVGPGARSQEGLSPPRPLEARFHTAGFLQVAQVSPAPGSTEVAADALITVVFNRPVVPLQMEGDLPQPLRLDPAVPGQGRWVDTSVYVFQPEGGLPGGTTITATVEAGLTDVSGGLLADAFTWTFATAAPRLLEVSPEPGSEAVPRDAVIRLTFNGPMDRASVETAFSLTTPDGTPIQGTFEWSEDGREVSFVPAAPLDYAASYRVRLGPEARSAGGTLLVTSLDTAFQTVGTPAVLSSQPAEGAQHDPLRQIVLRFNAPMDEASLRQALSVEPAVEELRVLWQEQDRELLVFGRLQPATTYTLRLDTTATDPFGTPLAEPFSLTFTTTDLAPLVDFPAFAPVLTLPGGEVPRAVLQARNVSRLDLELYRLDFGPFLDLLANPAFLFGNPTPQGTLVRQWSEPGTTDRNRLEERLVTLQENPLPAGAYLLLARAPETGESRARFLVVRDVELLLKAAPDSVLVWAVDLADGTPAADIEVRLLDTQGLELARARTDANGLVTFHGLNAEGGTRDVYAVTGAFGEAGFGLTASNWSQGVSPYEYGVPVDTSPPTRQLYLYTDRPIYRPGHTVRYRGVLREVTPEGYRLPEQGSVRVDLLDVRGQTLASQTVPISDFGTFHGEFTLPEEADLGTYSLQTEDGRVFFEVAAFRKPEFEVTVTPSAGDVVAGDSLTAQVETTFFFGGPVAGAEVDWAVWAEPTLPPGVPQAVDWFGVAGGGPPFSFAQQVASGQGTTDENGRLEIEVPTDLEDLSGTTRLTIEATVTDEAGLPVTGRGQVTLHPAPLYLSLVPEQYALRQGETAVVRLHAADLEGQPLGGVAAEVVVERVTWEQVVGEEGRLEWQAVPTLVNRGEVQTESNGRVLVSFQPGQPGTYRVRARTTGEGGRQAEAEVNLWVAGAGERLWRPPAAGHMALVPDRATYRPGDTALILVPTPFDVPALALVTLEREGVLSEQVLTLSPDSPMLEIPLQEQHAPNVYLSVALIRPGTAPGGPALAFGLVELQVSAERQQLQVALTPDREQAAPGEEVRFTLEARDQQGNPVQAEFSLALVDKAVLALAEPNSLRPFEHLYGRRFLRVLSAASLAQDALRGAEALLLEGIGGGGGGLAPPLEVRQEFPDTAYWNASAVTDANGLAQVTVRLPDSLTTWRMEARGVTADTRVGQAAAEVVVTKDLLVRPVTPRFFTAGDLATVAAVVHNNTDEDFPVEVRLSAVGAQVEGPAAATTVDLPAGGQARVTWQIRVGEVDQVDLTFSAEGGGLQDASRPTVGTARDGALPVRRYTAPDTVATSGALTQEGQRLEVINLPRRFQPSGGSLRLELDPSPAAALGSALELLSRSQAASTEELVSQVLAPLSVLQALRNAGLEASDLAGETEARLQEVLPILRQRQNGDGGWGWWLGRPSDPYLTAYTLLGLAQARQAGMPVQEEVFQAAVAYLQALLPQPGMAPRPEDPDLQAFVLYALEAAGSGQPAYVRRLAAERESLGLRGRALLALSLPPGDEFVPPLLSDLETAAVRAATGAHWQEPQPDRRALETGVTTSALAMMALTRHDPGNPLLADAIRWLMAARDADGGWRSTLDTAWATLALSEWVRVTGGLNADFEFAVDLNGVPLASGRAGSEAPLTAVQVTAGLEELFPDRPNRLLLQRGSGLGTLYYTAHLTVFRPVEEVTGTSRGLSVQRTYHAYDPACDPAGLENPCPVLTSARVGDQVVVRVTLVVPSDQYHVRLEDPFPAGMEPLDFSLRTTPSADPAAVLPRAELLEGGWRWWWFTNAELRDDRLVLFAEYLPAGTYQYTYRLQAALPGEYRVLPTRAWALYFPEVFGQAPGQVFRIEGE